MPKTLLMSVWIWFLGAGLSAVMSGSYIGSTQTGVIDKLSVFTVQKIGFFPMPVPNWAFFDGLRSIMEPGNFSFLQGSPLIIVVYLFNIGLTVGFLVIFSAIVSSFFRR